MQAHRATPNSPVPDTISIGKATGYPGIYMVSLNLNVFQRQCNQVIS